LLVLLVSMNRVEAMDRWAALSMLESGDKDDAVGPNGEVSRYQIKPAIWNATAPAHCDPTDARAALAVAQTVMEERRATFENRFHHSPTDFEFYVLWNAPAQLIGTTDRVAITRPVAARAQRFCNLVASPP